MAVDGSPQREPRLYNESENVFFGIIAGFFAGGATHQLAIEGATATPARMDGLWPVEERASFWQTIPFLDGRFLKMENNFLVSEVIPALDDTLLHLVKEFIAFPFAYSAY